MADHRVARSIGVVIGASVPVLLISALVWIAPSERPPVSSDLLIITFMLGWTMHSISDSILQIWKGDGVSVEKK